jgi:hypothetical protein
MLHCFERQRVRVAEALAACAIDFLIRRLGLVEVRRFALCLTVIAQRSYTHWPILGNSIHSNHGLGIALQAFTSLPTPNDSGDADPGPNDLQNYPIITSAPVSSGSVSIAGTLNSTPSKQFRIEFFSGIGCHATGNGEGRRFLGAVNAVMTNGSGNATFNSAPFSVPAGHSVFTATATDPDGNTSELSQCFGTPALLFHDDFEGGCAGYD